MNDFSISREQLESELREYSQTLALVAGVKTAPIAAAQAREELPHVVAFIAHLEAMPQAASTRAPQVRCPFYREIRRCYAIASEAGCDVKADEAMRAAFGRFLGRAVESRAAMNGADWLLVGNEIKAHRLAW
jgi:hypothetical protein